MIVWWRGRGLLAIAIAATGGLAGGLAGGHVGAGIGVMASSPLVGLAGWALNVRGRAAEHRNEHTLCGVPFQYWSVVALIIGLNIWRF